MAVTSGQPGLGERQRIANGCAMVLNLSGAEALIEMGAPREARSFCFLIRKMSV